MSKIVTISQIDDRLEAASRWVLLLDEGLTSSDSEVLKMWLAEHPKNVAEFVEVAQVWDKMDDLTRLAELFPKDALNRDATDCKPVPAFRWPRRTVFSAAASIVVLIAAGLLLLPRMDLPGFDFVDDGSDEFLSASTAVHYETYVTAVGEQSSVLLPDGSVITLNTDSRLIVAYSETARVVQLQRGEIHIDVAEDSARPLSVVAGDRIVQAIGTSFSVEITQDDRIEVIVTEGKVVVGIDPTGVQARNDADVRKSRIVAPPVLEESDGLAVEAGEELIFGTDADVVVPMSVNELEVKLSWLEGRLIFRSEPLEKALAEVERYTTVEFVLLDEKLKTKRVSGRFRAGDVDALLLSLETNFSIVHEIDADGRILINSR